MAKAHTPLYLYARQLKEATQNIVESEIVSPLRRNSASYDQWIAEALHNPEQGVPSPPRLSSHMQFRDDSQSGQSFLHANFDILCSTLRGVDAVRSLVAPNGGNGYAAQQEHGAECQLQNAKETMVMPLVESPSKRAKTIQEEIDSSKQLPQETEGAPNTVATSEAELQDGTTLEGTSLSKMSARGEQNRAERLACQGLLAGAPSPCRAVRLGPMPSSPPKQPPPHTSKQLNLDTAQEAKQVTTDCSLPTKQERALPEQPSTCEETSSGLTSSLVGAATDGRNESLQPLLGASLAVPAAFAQRSTVDGEAVEEASPSAHSPPAVMSTGWQTSALFAPPPASPEHSEQATDAVGLSSAVLNSTVQAQRQSLRTNPLGSLVPTEDEPTRATGKGTLTSSENIGTKATHGKEAPQQAAKPNTVSQKIMMFETRSTPCLRQPTPPPSSTSGNSGKSKGGLGTLATSSSMSKIISGNSLVNGSSLFTPLQASSNFRQKELYRSHSETMQTQRQLSQQQSGSLSWKPEIIVKERQERSQASAPSATSTHAPGSSTTLGAGSSLMPARGPSTTIQSKVHAASSGLRPMGSKACERLAAGGRRDDIAKPRSLKAAEQVKQQEERKQRERRERELDVSSNSIEGCSAAKARPPVPTFKPDPAMMLRQIDLKPKLDEDNYEISEHEENSDEDADKSRDRSGKHVPRWCSTYLEDLQRQADIDPDTIFASKVSCCDLDAVFTDDMYREVGKQRPKRLRGSSGDWRKDRLSCMEIKSYKSRMGHLRSWDEEVVASKGTASAESHA